MAGITTPGVVLTSKLDELGEQLPELMDKVFKERAEAVAEKARERAPRSDRKNDRHLADNIAVLPYSGEQGYVGYRVAANRFYAHFVEFGTVRQEAQPFLMEPYEEETADLREDLAKVIEEAAE
jgi:HK97 gp10 family phage protein